ncbi:DgyrCDS1305 [Dimorphilus gyrociliatus]|uniref:Exocyst complex component n=1 Tax=Dimorphilus gyrociliatus TaxID=2664684 RepID=A0A7I8V754_9ANNE|nr:DgyrCDS1305 [Dimorphilus gyrociliatus]
MAAADGGGTSVVSDENGLDKIEDETEKKHKLIIAEIENSEGHLGTAIRNVYKEKAPEKFVIRLDERIKEHDKDIETMCNFHYQSFIESILGLLDVRSDVDQLFRLIERNNKELQDSGKKLTVKGQKLLAKRQMQKNIADAIEHLSMCLPVLEMYKKLEEQMNNNKFYSALKTLEELEHSCLPRVRDYKFAESMTDSIQEMRKKIQTRSKAELNSFLTNLRKSTSRIGELAMIQSARNHGIDESVAQKKKKRPAPSAPSAPNPFTDEVESHQQPEEEMCDEYKMSPQESIDYSPIYRCLHIYQVLRIRSNFDKYYQDQREQQSKLALSPPQALSQIVKKPDDSLFGENVLNCFRQYLHEVSGFFIIEEHVMNTIKSADGKTFLDKLWKTGLQVLSNNLLKYSAYIRDPEYMLKVKNLLLLFCKTLQSYGFDISPMESTLVQLRELYANVLVSEWRDRFKRITDEDNYHPMEIESEEEYAKLFKDFPYKIYEQDNITFPTTLPFSSMVPKSFKEVLEYILACRNFTEGLQISDAELDDMIRKDANSVLSIFNTSLAEVIDTPRYEVQQKLIQLSVNMDYLEKSCVYLEEFISKESNVDATLGQTSKLLGSSMFKDARGKAEVAIYRNIEEKLDEMFSCNDYDWTSDVPLGQASPFIKDAFTYLEATFVSFANLPKHVFQMSCLSACKHIACWLMKMITDPQVTAITLTALQQFELDVVWCEMFANKASKELIGDLGDDFLAMTFYDLRQVVDLFLNNDWSLYLSDFGKPEGRYSRVDGNVALTILEKMKEGEKRNKGSSVLTTLKRKSPEEKNRKKLTDSVIKELRNKLSNLQP